MKWHKSPTRWLFALILIIALLATASPQSHQAEAGAAFGTKVGEYNGVIAYSNGSNDYASNLYNYETGINTGMKWQCVEYVNRYYRVIYGINIRVPGTNANQYYDTASDRGLVAYPNGGSTSPQPGDLLCSDGGSYGHVAIVRSVASDSIQVIHQNWSNTTADNDKSITMMTSGGNYTVSGFSGSYPVQGWLRPPSASDTTPPETFLVSAPSGTIGYNNVSFTWTASDDVTPVAELVYSYYLEGYDSGWSDWTSATSKEYTGLSSVNYTFRVKAKDEAGNIDPTPAESSFNISGILIEGADSVREFDMKPSVELADSTSSVVPRVLAEYANSTRHYNLAIPPSEFANLASQVPPRVMIEYANSTYHYNLAEPPAELANLTGQVPPRLMLEYANSNSCFDLAFPCELINDTVPLVVTDVTVINIAGDSATVVWGTDEFATSRVKYGKEAGVYTDTVADPLFIKEHQLKLTGLAPGTYYFVVAGTDQSGNSSQSAEYSFTNQGTITGVVKLPGNKNSSEVNISINGLNINPDSEGNFSLQVASGTYTGEVSKSGYLSAQRKGVIVEAGETTPLPKVVLLGGDADNNGLIDAEDLNLTGSRFNSADTEADINDDGIVDVYDLALAGINFGKAESPWL